MEERRRGGRETRARVDFITFSKYQVIQAGRENCLRMLIRCWWMNDLIGLSRRIYRRAATSRRVRRPEHRPLFASDIKL